MGVGGWEWMRGWVWIEGEGEGSVRARKRVVAGMGVAPKGERVRWVKV